MKNRFPLIALLAFGVLATTSVSERPMVAVESATGALTVGGVSGIPEFKAAKVEGGTFQMGAHDNQLEGSDEDERPLHRVTISTFYICKTEVTQELWRWVMNNNPSRFEGNNLPVENVSWDDCEIFLKRINKRVTELKLPRGSKFRLPTEAEWEYAARGGNKSRGYIFSGSNNVNSVAWYGDNANNTTHPVGTKAPNELDIYDMTGNVYEWCADRFTTYTSAPQTNPRGGGDGNLCMRGGGFSTTRNGSRISYRNYSGNARLYDYVGLRLVVVLPRS